MISIVKAIVYYVMIILHACMYNVLAEIIHFTESILKNKLNIESLYKYSIMHHIPILCAHAQLFVLFLLRVKIYLNQKILNDRILWISNHRSKLDGTIIQAILHTNGNNGMTVIKKSILYIPFVGPLFKLCEQFFITKRNYMNTLVKNAKKSMCLDKSILIFPEGGTMSPDLKKLSDDYAQSIHREKFDNVLIPKTTGFDIVQKNGGFRKLGDITIYYGNPEIPKLSMHSYLHLFKVFPTEIYLDIQYINDMDYVNLFDLFERKDRLLKNFSKDGYNLSCGYSKIYIVLNAFLFMMFYSSVLFVPYFMTMIFIISCYSFLRIILFDNE